MLREPPATRTAAQDTAIALGADRPPTAALAVAGAAEVMAQVERLLAQSRRQRVGFALLCVGVERIEGVDGPVGPQLEDRVREEVAHRMRARIRATDRLLRESVRDACVLLPGGGEETAQRVVERFVRALNGAYRVGEQLVRVRVRVGSATHPAHGMQASELLRKASERLCG